MEVTLRKLGIDLMDSILQAMSTKIISVEVLLIHLQDDVPTRHLPTLRAYFEWCVENKVELKKSTLEISFYAFLKAKATKILN